MALKPATGWGKSGDDVFPVYRGYRRDAATGAYYRTTEEKTPEQAPLHERLAAADTVDRLLTVRPMPADPIAAVLMARHEAIEAAGPRPVRISRAEYDARQVAIDRDANSRLDTPPEPPRPTRAEQEANARAFAKRLASEQPNKARVILDALESELLGGGSSYDYSSVDYESDADLSEEELRRQVIEDLAAGLEE